MKQKNFGNRLFWAVVGNYLIAAGIVFLRISGQGADPFTVMNLGISSLLPISYGTYTMLFNIAIFIPIYLLDKSSFGIGGLVNMLLLAYMVEFNMWIASLVGLTENMFKGNLFMALLFMLIGIVLICIGVAFYTYSDLGASPWDYLGILIEKKTQGKVPYKISRVVYDCIALFIGFITGQTLGIGTFVAGFFTGPFVSFFKNTLAKKYVKLG